MATQQRQYHTFYRSPTNWKELLTKLLSPSPLAYLVHAERLPDLLVRHFRYIWAIDDFEALVEFKGYEVEVRMDWEGDLFLSADKEMPDRLFQTIAKHFDNYRLVPPWKVNALRKRYRKPAKVTWIEK